MVAACGWKASLWLGNPFCSYTLQALEIDLQRRRHWNIVIVHVVLDDYHNSPVPASLLNQFHVLAKCKNKMDCSFQKNFISFSSLASHFPHWNTETALQSRTVPIRKFVDTVVVLISCRLFHRFALYIQRFTIPDCFIPGLYTHIVLVLHNNKQ